MLWLSLRVFKQAHPCVLHVESKNDMTEENDRPSGKVGKPSAELCGLIGAGEQENLLSIVPVQVKAAKGSQILKVFALLDPGSTAAFCSEALMSQLNLKDRKTHILLSKINQKKKSHCAMYLELKFKHWTMKTSYLFLMPKRNASHPKM